ncbi:pyridine nucleotide-disulphide oxidoreductase class-ii [Lucifera butyrica]|uniref:Pyridine nucleotide-disulphide oxidoreductase class-ii n=1 Tax=Lucifera butyrica TaxID=1351585 RepID=A0A498R3I2_9FIRM|nr:FAD-dependent oxidoreductase [Lucifera butyrica]VBB05360.1 pyridine nucleotide-disulphide oxidoreductase class-ii [Lucifera butyrica]
MEKKREYYDVAIIGGGAAGLTAAIYCGRARLKTILFEKALTGGLATYTSEIENYPGFPEGISGINLMKLFEKQAKKFGVDFKLTAIKEACLGAPEKVISTFRADYVAKAVIVASGGKPRLTGALGEEAFLYDKGISFCATCDAAYYTGKSIMVVGSGDAAIEEAMFLTKFAKRVQISVIHDKGIVDANEVAKEQAFANPKLEFIWNTVVHEFKGQDRLNQVVLKNIKTEERIPVDVDGCFLFIGYLPDTEIFKGKVNMDSRGYIVTNETMETNLPGVFAVGDVRVKGLRQVATAVGDGAIGGVAAERYLAESAYFEQKIMGEQQPTLVYCWNPIDPACRSIMAEVEKLKEKYKEQIKVVTVDMYKAASLAERLNIRQAPSFALVKDRAICCTVTECSCVDSVEQEIKKVI